MGRKEWKQKPKHIEVVVLLRSAPLRTKLVGRMVVVVDIFVVPI